jgi:flagellar basal body-associated protein FliL
MENNATSITTIIIVTIVLIALAAWGGWWVGSSSAPATVSNQNQAAVQGTSEKQLAFDRTMDQLWQDHIIWTRSYVVSAANNLPDKDQVLARLMKNQEDIGNAIKPYYGDAAASQVTTLLKAHISGAGEVLAAAMAKDNAKLTSANASWHDNANQIADLLAQANPNWSKDDLRKMMDTHLNLLSQEVSDILSKKSEASIADYDKTRTQILEMSKMLADGIVKQFPSKF